MPPGIAALRLLLVAVVATATFRLARSSRPRARVLAAVVALGLLPLQLAVVRWPRAVTGALPFPDLVFFAELWVELAVALGIAAVLAQEGRRARLRTGVSVVALVAVAVAASWGLVRPRSTVSGGGRVQKGVVLQTERSSCAAAAAATLLRALAIDPAATEERLASLCLTDARRGTTDLGLFRGLALAAPGRRPRFVSLDVAGARALGTPCVAFVGLDARRVKDPELHRFLRDRCNWDEGEEHAVVLFGFGRDPGKGDVARIGDPRFGAEDWPLAHFEALWDGTALVLDR